MATAVLLLLLGDAGLAKDGVPIPRPNPRRGGATTAETAPAPVAGWSATLVAEERRRCDGLLKGLDLRYKALPSIGQEAGCGAPAPIEVSAVAGAVLDPPAVTSCDMGYGLAKWISGSVQPAAQRLLKTRVTVIHTASSYVCRGRNGVKGGKLSEHGKANALDMAGFTFAGSKDVVVGDGWGGILQGLGLSRGGSFLSAIRADACTHFATVLGPGSDAYHGNHFHVDAIRRKNGYRICQ